MQAPVGLVQQDTILVKLHREGYQISKRTLGLWRTQGLIPPLVRIGNEYFCPRETWDRLKVLVSMNGSQGRGYRFGSQPEILFTHKVEGDQFNIVRAEIVRVEGSIRLVLHEEEERFFVLTIGEEDLNALTGGEKDIQLGGGGSQGILGDD